MRRTNGDYKDVKDFLMRSGKQVFETIKNLYYVDYNGCPCRFSK